MDTTHQAASLAVEIRPDFLLEGGLVQVATADSDTQCDSFLFCFASDILEDGNRGVDASAFTEKGADGSAGALGGNENDIDVGRHIDFSQVLEDRGEAMGEVKGLSESVIKSYYHLEGSYLSLGELRLDGRPSLGLRSVGEQVHDNGTLGNGLINFEKVCAWDPAILLCFFPRCAILPHADNHVQAIVSEVETLTVALRAIADEGESVVLEVFLHLISWNNANVRAEVLTCSFSRGQSARSTFS